MLRDKDQSAPRAGPLAQRLSRLLHIRRSSWASSASAERTISSGTATSAPSAPQSDPPPATATIQNDGIARPIVEDMAPPSTPPAEPTLPISLPEDPRVEHRFAQVNGIRYHYLYAEPAEKWRATVFLVGG
jgi:hypothetical protein